MEGNVGLILEKSDELIGREDGADFDAPVFFDELEPLSGFEAEGFADFLWDDDLEFG